MNNKFCDYMAGKLLPCLIALLVLLLPSRAIAQGETAPGPERKTDYFERIYFSGQNHDGINALYRKSLQELEGKRLSPALTQQYEYLVALQENVTNSSNTCEALEIIGAAIHELDEDAAQKLQIPLPTTKAKGNLLNTISSTVAAKTDSASVINRRNAQFQEGKEVVDILRSFIPPKKDKPCKSIVARVVEIGYHPTPAEAAKDEMNEIKEINGKKYLTKSNITIKNISFSQLTEIKAQLKKTVDIVEVRKGEYKNDMVVFEIMHNLDVDDVVNLIVNQKKQYKVKVESITGDDGVLVITK